MRQSIERLRANRWLEVERQRSTLTLRPGERMRKLWRSDRAPGLGGRQRFPA